MANKEFKPVTHCIFDMDGLLLDTETLYTVAYNTICQKYGKTYTWEHKSKIMGFKTHEASQAVINMLELPITIEEFEEQLAELYMKTFPECQLMPGAERLLRHLKKNNVPIILATSSSQESYDIKTRRWEELFALFEHRICGGSDPEVKRGKPHPDIFLVAASRFSDKPEPSKCLVFEDSPNGVIAAINADMQTVMVPDINLPKDAMPKNPTIILKSLEEFKPELFGLPPFSD